MGPTEWVQAAKPNSTNHASAIRKRTSRNTADQLSKRVYKFFINQTDKDGGVNAVRSRTKAAIQ